MRQWRQAVVWGCIGWFSSCPYYDLRSNTVPLAYGMTPDAVSAALNVPLVPVTGGKRSEVFYAERQSGMPWTTVFADDRQLWLQFRNGHLTGWKNNWSRPAWW
jgi:hypothetical protein